VGSSVGVFYFTRSNQQNPYPPYGTLALDDPLSDNSHGYNWHDSGDSSGTCAFTGGAYHVNALQQGSNHFCIASRNFSDFAYQVQMTIVKGFAGGIIFRDDDTRGNFYLFGIGQDGGYQLDSVNAGNFQILRTRGSGTATNAGLNQSILLAIVAHGSTIEVYVNNKKIESVNDSSYTQGQIGVFESDQNGNGTTEVVFSNAKVWT
jgi:eukaryotic-like serine/threonine-protein kinase